MSLQLELSGDKGPGALRPTEKCTEGRNEDGRLTLTSVYMFVELKAPCCCRRTGLLLHQNAVCFSFPSRWLCGAAKVSESVSDLHLFLPCVVARACIRPFPAAFQTRCVFAGLASPPWLFYLSEPPRSAQVMPFSWEGRGGRLEGRDPVHHSSHALSGVTCGGCGRIRPPLSRSLVEHFADDVMTSFAR